MDSIERRQIGAHYTAEKNILKLIRPLFLDELRAEFDAAKADKSTRRTARLEALHQKLGSLTFLDPACGCGNFLVITYRELRALELEILLELHRDELGQTQHEFSFDLTKLSKVDVDQMYGIEIEEFPAKIAEVALWLADHQANIAMSEVFGQLYRRIPLKKSPHIVCANALRTDWKTVLPPEKCSFILGNPPFVGKHYQSAEQKDDLRRVWKNAPGTGILDFITAWHALAADYMLCSKPMRCAFVSTNSICQGEQASILWSRILGPNSYKIHFAHRTFSWESEARGKAHVHCVIVGFGFSDAWGLQPKALYDYDNNPEQPIISHVSNISPYLVEGSDHVVTSRTHPLCEIPEMTNGSKPVDGGNLILSDEDKGKLLAAEPAAEEFIRPLVGSDEFINGGTRWCLWLEHAPPAKLRAMPEVMKRIEGVKAMRLASTDKSTQVNASRPSLFSYIRQPSTRYLAIPEVSSENRRYVPMAFLSPDIVCTNKIQYVPDASNYDFGMLTSQMHMAWMRQVCGRLKSDYSYSKNLVYNNFPWPMEATEAQRAKVEECAKEVLSAREQFPGSTLADLYDPVSMPPRLAKAHEQLDRAVDRCYRKDAFLTDRHRVEYLFSLYEQLTAPLVVEKKTKKSRTKKTSGTTRHESVQLPTDERR